MKHTFNENYIVLQIAQNFFSIRKFVPKHQKLPKR